MEPQLEPNGDATAREPSEPTSGDLDHNDGDMQLERLDGNAVDAIVEREEGIIASRADGSATPPAPPDYVEQMETVTEASLEDDGTEGGRSASDGHSQHSRSLQSF